MGKKNSSKKSVVQEVKYTDIIHEMRDGVMMDVYLNGKKEVKSEPSRE